MTTPTLVAPPGLKGLVVADTTVGDVRGTEGFFHYRQHDATEVSAMRSFEAVAHLLLEGALPDSAAEAAFRAALGERRVVSPRLRDLASRLAGQGHGPLESLRALVSLAVHPTPSLDQDDPARRRSVMTVLGATPTLLAAVHRSRQGLDPIDPDPGLPHPVDYVRMVTGRTPTAEQARAVETYLSLTVDHGFNASTFACRVITSTGANVGGAYAGAMAALSGPLHGGAPGRVLDMLEAIGAPANAEAWARAELAAGRKLMGFGHAVYRAEDPRSRLLREVACALGGPLVERARAIETRLLAFLRGAKPTSTILTNVEYWAAVALSLAGIPQSMFTATFTTSRVVGWGAHLLEQAAHNKILRPAARYVGPEPPVPVPASPSS